MKFDKVYGKGQARLFESDVLEALTKAPPWLIWGMYTPVIVYLLYYANAELGFSGTRVALTFLVGMISWSLFEYFAHRFIFHWEPKTDRARKFVYIMHGNHHEYPRDRQRLFMPPLPSILIASILFSLMYLGMGLNVFMFFPGFLLGYLMYGSMHYAIHAWNPPFKWMKPLWKNHHMHHYKNEHQGFGVSSTLWDLVFGTMFNQKEQEDKEKVKELMFDQ